MTAIDQAEALLKAAELIVSNQKLTDLRIAGDYEPDEFDAQELDEANAHLFVWAVPIARAFIEKQAALEEAVGLLKEINDAFETHKRDFFVCEECHAQDDFAINDSDLVLIVGEKLKDAQSFLARQGAE